MGLPRGGVPNLNIKYTYAITYVVLWYSYGGQCLVNSCFPKLFWGEIQCSPVS